MLSKRTLLGAIGAVALLGSGGPAAAQEDLHRPDLQGLPAPVLAGREGRRREGRQGLDVTHHLRRSGQRDQVDKPDRHAARRLCAKNPTAIGFAALDSQAAIPLLQQAKEPSIPVIAFDSGVDSDIPVTTATTDNLAAAALAADKMAELIGGEGKVALVVHDQTSRTGIDRRDGFVNRIKEKLPEDRNRRACSMARGDHLKSTEITKSILQANPRPQGHLRRQRRLGHRRGQRRQGAEPEDRHHRL